MIGGGASISRLKTGACRKSAHWLVHYPALMAIPDVNHAYRAALIDANAACGRVVFRRFHSRFGQFRIIFWRFSVLFCLLPRTSTFSAVYRLY